MASGPAGVFICSPGLPLTNLVGQMNVRLLSQDCPQSSPREDRAGGIHSVIQGNSGGRIEFGPVHKARPSTGLPLHNSFEVIWYRYVVMRWDPFLADNFNTKQINPS